jgi:hypothetical protein
VRQIYVLQVKAAFEAKAAGVIIVNVNSADTSQLLSIPLGPNDKPSKELVRASLSLSTES